MNSMINGVRIYRAKVSSDIEFYIYGEQSFRIIQSLAARRKGLFYEGLNKKFSNSFYERILRMTSNSGTYSSISSMQKYIRLSRYLKARDSTKLGNVRDAVVKYEVHNIYEATKELFEYKLKVYQDDLDELLNRLLYTLLTSEDIDNCGFSVFNNVFYCFRKIQKIINMYKSNDDKISSVDDEVFYLKKDKVQDNISSYVLTFDFLSVFRAAASKRRGSDTDILIKKAYELLHEYIEKSEARYSSLHFDIQKAGNLRVDVDNFSVDFYLNVYATYLFDNQTILIFLVSSEVDMSIEEIGMGLNFHHATAFAFKDDHSGLMMNVYNIYTDFYDDSIKNILKINKKGGYLVENIRIREKTKDYIDLKRYIRMGSKRELIKTS